MEYLKTKDREDLIILYWEDIVIEFENKLEEYLQTSNKKYKNKKAVLLNWIKKEWVKTLKELEEEKTRIIKSTTLYDSEWKPCMIVSLTADWERHYSLI